MFNHLKQLIANMLLKSYAFLVPPGEAGLEQYTKLNAFTASEEGYKQVVWVFRCVNEVAKRVSSVPWKVYRDTKSGEREEIEGLHPLKSFMQRPNKHQGWASFAKAHMTLLLISGNSYWDISNRIGNTPVGVYLLRPDRMTLIPVEGNDERVRNYCYTYGANKIPIDPRDIVHYSYYDPTNDYFGLSPVYVAGNVIDTETEAIGYNKYLMRNQARPSGVLQTEQKLQEEPFKRLQAAIQTWMGNKNAGKPIILEAGLKWAQTQLSQKDADYINLRKLNREEICAVFGVPPIVAGILDRATYSNYEEGDTMIWGQTIIPELRLFRDDFNGRVAPLFDPGLYIDYDLEHVEALKENEDAVHKRARDDYQGGIITFNEARKLTGDEEIPGGHFFLLQNTVKRVFISAEAQKAAIEPENTTPPPVSVPGLMAPKAPGGKDPEKGDGAPQPPKKAIAPPEKVDEETNPNAKEGKALDIDELMELKAKALDAQFNKLHAKSEKKLIKALKKYFTEQQIEVEENVRAGKSEVFDVEAWDANAVTHLKPTMETIFNSAGAHGSAEVGWNFNQHDPSAIRFSNHHLMDHWGEVGSINQTTYQQLQTALQTGTEEDEGVDALIHKIEAVYDLARESRVGNIALTEANYAINMGLLQAYNQAGAKKGIRKYWEDRDDGRVRETHSKASYDYPKDKAIKLFDTFKVGAGRCLCPGHTGLAEEDINCRCRVRAVVYDR
jgi:HK97 family phage portal protein